MLFCVRQFVLVIFDWPLFIGQNFGGLVEIYYDPVGLINKIARACIYQRSNRALVYINFNENRNRCFDIRVHELNLYA